MNISLEKDINVLNKELDNTTKLIQHYEQYKMPDGRYRFQFNDLVQRKQFIQQKISDIIQSVDSYKESLNNALSN